MADYRAKKRFGQHFLTSSDIVDNIVSAVAPRADMTIVEIGPGRGAITVPMAESGARIIGVEFDRDLIGSLGHLLKPYPHCRLVDRDILTVNPKELTEDRFVLVGNLPYNITSPVLSWVIEYRDQISRAVLMMQEEVARRVTSSPGGKDWSPMAILGQLHFAIEYCFGVPPQSFTPPPKVNSAVIRLVRQESVPVSHPASFERVVRQAFRQRRKLLINNLVPTVTKDAAQVAQVLERLGLPGKTRAEEISIDRFAALTLLLIEQGLISPE